MIVNTDPSGLVVLLGDAPSEWNGVTLTAYELTPDEELAWTALPADRAGVMFDGKTFTLVPMPAPTAAEIQMGLESAVQAHLDAKAMERGYSSILSAATYVTSTDPTFQAEGIGYRNFRDAAWRYCYDQLAAVQSGKRSIPTADQLISEIDANCPLVLP